MTTTYFFSHDEDGLNFFDDVFSLRKNTPRIEDCYVYVGEDGLKCKKFDYDQDEWYERREDSMSPDDWMKKQFHKFQELINESVDADENITDPGILEVINSMKECMSK